MARHLPLENLTMRSTIRSPSNAGTIAARTHRPVSGPAMKPARALGLVLAAFLAGCAAPTSSPPTSPSPNTSSAPPRAVESEPVAEPRPADATEGLDPTSKEPANDPSAEAATAAEAQPARVLPPAEPEPAAAPTAPAPPALADAGDQPPDEPAAGPDGEAAAAQEADDRVEAAAEPRTPVTPAPVAVQRSLRGRVTLQGGDAEVSQTVVYFEPEGGAAPPAPGVFDVETRDKTFDPTVIVVPRGSEVRFPNRDPILHNVFSVSGDNAFDLGVYGPDTAPATTLEQTGAVNVYCNVHHDMHAHVLVLDTPWFVQVGPDGRFSLDGLPPGPGRLTAWHRQAETWSMSINENAGDTAAGPIEIRLDINRPQLPEHMDKTGQSYFRRDRDPYR
jgi:plastocyanin